VKVDFATFKALNKSVYFVAKKSYDKSRYFVLRMNLNLSTLPLNQFLELSLRSIEGSPHHRRQSFVKIAFASVANCHQFVFRWYGDADPHAERIPTLLVRLRFLNGNAATHEVRANAFELSGLPADERFYSLALRDVAKSHL
jgi:hypothetical protein